MKILIISLGTRGDIEPFLAIGEILQKNGHDVICALPEQFRRHTLESNLEFMSLGSDFIELVHSKEGKSIMGSEASLPGKLIRYYTFYKNHIDIRNSQLQIQLEIVNKVNPDRIIHSGLVLYPFIWELQNKFKTTLILPVPYLIYPVKEFSHILLNRNWGSFINTLTYKLTNFFVARGIKSSARILQLPVGRSSLKIAQDLLLTKPSSPFLRPYSLHPPIGLKPPRCLDFMIGIKSTTGSPLRNWNIFWSNMNGYFLSHLAV